MPGDTYFQRLLLTLKSSSCSLIYRTQSFVIRPTCTPSPSWLAYLSCYVHSSPSSYVCMCCWAAEVCTHTRAPAPMYTARSLWNVVRVRVHAWEDRVHITLPASDFGVQRICVQYTYQCYSGDCRITIEGGRGNLLVDDRPRKSLIFFSNVTMYTYNCPLYGFLLSLLHRNFIIPKFLVLFRIADFLFRPSH